MRDINIRYVLFRCMDHEIHSVSVVYNGNPIAQDGKVLMEVMGVIDENSVFFMGNRVYFKKEAYHKFIEFAKKHECVYVDVKKQDIPCLCAECVDFISKQNIIVKMLRSP